MVQGIGYETALALARKDYEVTLACRDMGKAAEAEQRLRCGRESYGRSPEMLSPSLSI